MADIDKNDDFETLMRARDEHAKHYIERSSLIQQQTKSVSERYTADSNCSCFDFIKMVQRLVNKSLNEYNIDFSSDRLRYKITDPQIELDHPAITYEIISRKPDNELKPRIRETIYDNDAKMIGNIYAQKFECIIQFNVFASVYDLADEVITNFENMMIKYAGYFKRNGVNELLFEEELQDDKYNLFRQVVSVRNIRYRIRIENIYNNLSEIIDDAVINNVTEPVDNLLAKEKENK